MRSRVPVWLAAAGLTTIAALGAPAPVLGHQLIGRVESPLPLAAYLGGAALAVGLSFAFVILRDVRAPAPGASVVVSVPAWLAVGLRAIGLIGWLWIVVQTILGGETDADVSILFLWVYGWVGVAFLSALVGPIWTWLDPFTTLYDAAAWTLRRLGLAGQATAAPPIYPAGLGQWPAVVGLAFFVWLELAYRGGGLGLVLIGYTALTLLAMAAFGRDAWRANGETFSVWFGTLNRLAPFGREERDGEAGAGPEDRRVIRRGYAVGLLAGDWSIARVTLVAIGVASILYDGLSQTTAWFDLFGSPFLPEATLELLAFLGLVVALALAVARLVGLAAVGGGLVPIAVGYLIAHYLTYILGDGQRIVVALSDPFQQGWNLIGFAEYEPGIDWIPPVLAWAVMLAAVVGGHVVGAWSGHVLAVRDAPLDRRPAATANLRLRQVPLAALMVVLTATTLWSLGQTIVKEPSQEAAIVPAFAAAVPDGAMAGSRAATGR
jgi:hypothetical protein